MFTNLYAIFDLPNYFDDEREIRRMYKVLGSRWHPLRNINMEHYAEKRFKDLSKAFEILSDPESRERYNKLLSEAPNEIPFVDVLQPYYQDKGFDYYDNMYKNELIKDNVYFDYKFFKLSDKEFKDMEGNGVFESLKTNTIIKNGKRVTKQTKVMKDNLGNKTTESIEDHGEGNYIKVVDKIYHDEDGNLIKQITEDTGNGPQLREKRLLALSDKSYKQHSQLK